MNETQTAAVHPLEEMGISREVVQAFDWMGFQNLTAIQQKCIPLMMDGHDIIAIAPTGTGKTLGFGIPMLEYVNLDDSNIQEVVLAPTRELAQQIADELTHLAHFIKGLKIAVIYGGQPFGKQMSALSRKPQVLVATPGRLLDHMQRGNIRLGTVHTMVLDEADEMLKMGFVQDVEKIIESADPNRQLVMFSATTNQDVLTVSWKYQHDPIEIVVQAEAENKPNITQYIIESDQKQKYEHLLYLLDSDQYKRVMIFCNTKDMTARLCDRLKKAGYQASAAERKAADAAFFEQSQILSFGNRRMEQQQKLAAFRIDTAHLRQIFQQGARTVSGVRRAVEQQGLTIGHAFTSVA